MGKFLVPMSYYTSGYSGTVNDFTLTMSGATVGYEVYKAFSTDDKEYLKYTGYIVMSNEYVSSGTQGTVVVSNHLLSSTSNKLYLQEDDNSGFSTPTTKTIAAIYGDGEIGDDTFNYLYAGSSPITGITKSLVIYPGSTSYQYYRYWVTPTSNQRIQMLTHGILYDVPDNYRLESKSFEYSYRGSEVYENLLGTIYYDGVQNNYLKKTHTLEFQYLNETDKNTLLTIFQLGKGGLPIWFIDDTSDNTSWIFCGMKTMQVSEPYINYFNVTIKLVEY